MNENDVKKDLYKSKAMAKFSHYNSGKLYYRVDLADGTYQFPIATVEDKTESTSIDMGGYYTNRDLKIGIQLSSDLGQTNFGVEIKGSDLNRWISKAIKKDEFIKVA